MSTGWMLCSLYIIWVNYRSVKQNLEYNFRLTFTLTSTIYNFYSAERKKRKKGLFWKEIYFELNKKWVIYINTWLSVCDCLFVSNKRQNCWTDRAQIKLQIIIFRVFCRRYCLILCEYPCICKTELLSVDMFFYYLK